MHSFFKNYIIMFKIAFIIMLIIFFLNIVLFIQPLSVEYTLQNYIVHTTDFASDFTLSHVLDTRNALLTELNEDIIIIRELEFETKSNTSITINRKNKAEPVIFEYRLATRPTLNNILTVILEKPLIITNDNKEFYECLKPVINNDKIKATDFYPCLYKLSPEELSEFRKIFLK